MQITTPPTINYAMSIAGTNSKSALLPPVINLAEIESMVESIETVFSGVKNDIYFAHNKLNGLWERLATIGLSSAHKVEGPGKITKLLLKEENQSYPNVAPPPLGTCDGRNDDDAMLVEEDKVSIILFRFYYTIVHIILIVVTYCFSFCLYVPAPILPRRIFSHWPRMSHTQSR